MKKFQLFFISLLFGFITIKAQEKLLYSTNFQDWEALANATTEKSVTKTTDFSQEQLDFRFFQNSIAPSGWDASRFKAPATPGYMLAAKVTAGPTSYVITSPLKSITKIVFTHGATGSSRGYRVWKKNASDTGWVALTAANAYAVPASGQTVTVNVNDTLVALKFTNLNEAQNAYMFDLAIYGNHQASGQTYALTTSSNIDSAGSITRTPNSDVYQAGTNVVLKATPNFGYKFVKWVNGSTEEELSTSNPYRITINEEAHIKAIFQPLNTYALNLNIQGSSWGEIQLNPAPTKGKYEEGTQVTMKVVPNPVTAFSFWEDNSTAPERVVTMTENKTFTATFDEVPFIVGWSFRNADPKVSRPGDYYAETSNVGVISLYEPTGTPVNWLSNAATFSPAYPNFRIWTAGTEFVSKRRYVKAQFSTQGYRNIQVKSLIGANYQAYSVMTLQYSLDDVNYQEAARVDITDVYNVGWKSLEATLPDSAQNQAKVYLKWVADTSSAKLGNPIDNDGTAFTNIYVFADHLAANDTIAPKMLSIVPAANSNSATVNGAVVVTFDEKVKAGEGKITLGTATLTGVFGSKTATFTYERLDYNTEYTFNIPAGALTDLSGNAFAGVTIRFTTAQRTEPNKSLFDAVVAKDGSGDYLTVIDAIAAAPANRTLPWLIYVKNGKYTGHHDIPANKPFIHLIGQVRDSVIISDNRLSGNDGKGSPVYNVLQGATMVVNARDCYFENITFENSHGYEKLAGPQALALYAVTNHFTTSNCNLRSYQDTYLTAYNVATDRQYHKNTIIEGAVDYIYGGGDVFFDRCILRNNRADGGFIVAPSHAVGTLWGYVFSNCSIEESKVSNANNFFGRPWVNSPKTVFLNTILKTGIKPEGWYYKMGAIPAIFADYNTMDKNGNPVDLSFRISNYEYDVKDANGNVTNVVKGTAKNKLSDAEAATYTYENVILRSGDSWDPRLMSEAPAQPANVKVTQNKLSWTHSAYTRLYIVFRNQKVMGFAIENSYTDSTAVTGVNYTYAVQAVGEFGALSRVVSADVVSSIRDLDDALPQLWVRPTVVTSQANVVHPKALRSSFLTIYNTQGQLMQTIQTAEGALNTNIDVSRLTAGVYLLRFKTGNGNLLTKFVKQ